MKFFLFFIFIFFVSCENFSLPPHHVEEEIFFEPDAEEFVEQIVELEPVPHEQDAVLRLHMRPPKTLNPLLNEDVTVARILLLIFEPLAVLDDEFRVVGNLAELDFASDFGSVNATIRDGAIWGDGIPVTADDVIFSINFLRAAPKNAFYKNAVENIFDAKKIDARTVQIIFERASVMAGYSLTFPIIPQHFYANAGNNSRAQSVAEGAFTMNNSRAQSVAEGAFTMNNSRAQSVAEGVFTIGSGPFALDEYVPMRSMTLRRNSYNFFSKIEQIDVVFLPDAETDFHAFERGRIDALHLPLTEWTRKQGVRSPVYEIFPAMYFEFIGFNFKKNFFRDVHTRTGIAHAFDAADAMNALYLAHATHSLTPIHPQNWAADDVKIIFDPARAAALLRTQRTVEPLIIIAPAENSQRAAIARKLANALCEVGLESRAEIISQEEYFERIAAFDFDLYIGGMKLSFAPETQIFFRAGELFFSDSALEAAHAALQFASTETAYVHALRALQQTFAERLPIIGLGFLHDALLANPRIASDLNPAPDHVFANLHEWKLR
ncbi:MAG: ABC transporter substrate-binding protein [Defluviitaleaceae bacterium]|nr:ABC transporter substrate-binding protein [Defluviitaleaceae bacterium]